jgi:prephenate dehydrogenase
MRIGTLAIVGVGLIGGSIALAARRRGLADRILGINHRPTTRDYTVRAGLVDAAFATPLEAVDQADVVVFCTPVDRLAAQVLEAAPRYRPGTLLTDAGSTKAAIVHEVEGKLPLGVAFVGAHPLAGSEKQGPEHAEADLLVGRLVILTPSPTTDEAAVSRVAAFWEALGARIRCMGPEEHDRALALTSHLPHLAASGLAGLLHPELSDLTAGGFRDTTRIAAGDPVLWTAIFQANRDALLAALDRFDARLQRFRAALAANDAAAIAELLREGKLARDRLGGR